MHKDNKHGLQSPFLTLPQFLPHQLAHLPPRQDQVVRPSTPPRNHEGPRLPVEFLEDRYRVDLEEDLKRISLNDKPLPPTA